MKISTKGRYALRMMLDLAEYQKDGYISLKDIAARQNISKKYLEQIVPMLNKNGMLCANRGNMGGYRLAKQPAQYTGTRDECLSQSNRMCNTLSVERALSSN